MVKLVRFAFFQHAEGTVMPPIGVYLAVSLVDARQRRDEAKRLLAQGIDPNAKNRLMKKSFMKSAIKPARPVSSPKADAP
ncbi:DUF4102 domain-containing protein [Salmonella enterica]|uniref:DUF4102 domain-containing protein n=2 Tax=Salmonella enterica TaxID=28901 RepID=A0A622TPG9_SALER|nr:DUF4102 domain-containing protein [Salmonella enterica subsp. enterica serovar Napoli]EAC0525553.1 DUF4102 domain-containing protein [Salmonella enterica subsp. enterica serovar Zaiman]EAM4684831.1 DUF4102 domain-containing protein [Salmonella enterica]EBN0192588.1 DUF4102 domain-containing protein [Salmonella enterica subsp. enterica serovar Enteritidis]EBV0850275.1 DUF4102 domain-containing protein [Salmonella enterica subsp. enterica serovar Fulica]EBZ5784866.1 DUF4102 domain-containing 